MVKYKKKSNSELYGGGNTCSLNKFIKIDYNNRNPSADNYFLYSTNTMKRLLLDIHSVEVKDEASYHKKICGLLELFKREAAGLAWELSRNGSKYSTDFKCRYPDFDRRNKQHQVWLLTSLAPGDIRAIVALDDGLQLCS